MYGDGGEVVAGLGEGELAVAECFELSPFARRRSHEPFREAPEAMQPTMTVEITAKSSVNRN